VRKTPSWTLRLLPILCAAAVTTARAGAAGRPAAEATGKPDLIKWRSIKDGEAEARSTKKPVLYFFTADWCGPCHLLREAVFTEPRAAELIRKQYVPVVVEDRSREEGKSSPDFIRLVSRFGLRGFPTLIVARPDKGRAVAVEGWAGKEKSYDFLSRARQRLVELEKQAAP
jgi:thiol:disulfide interchange protein